MCPVVVVHCLTYYGSRQKQVRCFLVDRGCVAYINRLSAVSPDTFPFVTKCLPPLENHLRRARAIPGIRKPWLFGMQTIARLKLTRRVTLPLRLLRNALGVTNVKSEPRSHQALLCPRVEHQGFRTVVMTITHPGRACLPAHIMYSRTSLRFTITK